MGVNIIGDKTYTINDNGEILFAKRAIKTTPATEILAVSSLDSVPITVTGLSSNDFAVFAHASDALETRNNIGFLVTEYRKTGAATLIAYDLLTELPQRFVTAHMRRLIKRADIDELPQFNIGGILDYIDLLDITK